jgi:alanine dehydrogenase
MLVAMPGFVPGVGMGAKLVTLFSKNDPPLPTHQAAIMLFDDENGLPIALMDATYITAIRTAATAALASNLLARRDAGVLAILGTGVQARAAQEMFPRVRDFTEIRVAGRGEYQEAVRGADVVHAATHSPDPIVLAEWLSPGVHVSSVGFNPPGSEVDRAIVARADVICVESRDSAFASPPAGACELSETNRDETVELGELVTGISPGRTDSKQTTLYKSVGLAVQDLAAAALVLAAAHERHVGLEIALDRVDTRHD